MSLGRARQGGGGAVTSPHLLNLFAHHATKRDHAWRMRLRRRKSSWYRRSRKWERARLKWARRCLQVMWRVRAQRTWP